VTEAIPEDESVIPEGWTQIVRATILTPFVGADDVVVSKETVDKFELFDSRAHAHALARGEHDALLYLHIYGIWNESLWRTKFDTWEDYCDEWDKSNYGVSKSSIKHKIADIKKMLAAGVSPEIIVKALGKIPSAARSLMNELVFGKRYHPKYVDRSFLEQLPHKPSVEQYLSELADLGPIQAHLAVDEITGKSGEYIDMVEFNEDTREIFFRVVHFRLEGRLESQLYIPDVPDWAQKIIVRRLQGKYG
jgi:hypothetical protein